MQITHAKQNNTPQFKSMFNTVTLILQNTLFALGFGLPAMLNKMLKKNVEKQNQQNSMAKIQDITKKTQFCLMKNFIMQATR